MYTLTMVMVQNNGKYGWGQSLDETYLEKVTFLVNTLSKKIYV